MRDEPVLLLLPIALCSYSFNMTSPSNIMLLLIILELSSVHAEWETLTTTTTTTTTRNPFFDMMTASTTTTTDTTTEAFEVLPVLDELFTTPPPTATTTTATTTTTTSVTTTTITTTTSVNLTTAPTEPSYNRSTVSSLDNLLPFFYFIGAIVIFYYMLNLIALCFEHVDSCINTLTIFCRRHRQNRSPINRPPPPIIRQTEEGRSSRAAVIRRITPSPSHPPPTPTRSAQTQSITDTSHLLVPVRVNVQHADNRSLCIPDRHQEAAAILNPTCASAEQIDEKGVRLQSLF